MGGTITEKEMRNILEENNRPHVETFVGATCYHIAPTFREELTQLLNKKCMENGSNTPDFILADFLLKTLGAFDAAVNARESWYGIRCTPGRARRKITPQ